ncbi:TatD family hydrolase [Tenacibaculum finnmarkense genomovar finnmarkense]|uniref:Hydrolase TatD n=1 Tax=Tenacibaculum finnmarkense genomovar ulcerans TaxID=2781388 RepID=A0A2I2M7Z2_9FLAO|nr:TatD family hydrolase [Tenacibaculum finnmarkense]MBE7686998.1 YchF/TatD family DNA exonuclease [Tenacibaculum finnmarkense genomovar ulcerans]MBE7692308.1 YchF/TatD family DNA exonuclease [Tenacibaculum finnmarkense genomovar finnmarkense]MBE7696557.1 YchF/TatD family DNA exonuclease [Tenacibaculum finnmarkense genomovar ulcerans]MCD8417112.1 TatD family hydrolase [Tenacibaculum finnmarkense genomovar finnmarkense]MCG8184495.1 TatD family hydrolase [Tenacibaculum finnmarkense genomovar fin
MITDTHTHLYSEEFDQDRTEMIQRAKDAGVSRFFIPAIDSSSTERMFDLEKNFPNDVFLMMGLHPTYVKENYKEELAHVKKWIDKRPFYAIGEIGIDLYWDKTFVTQQQEAFRTQIQWAKEKKLPIVIHCRDAFDEVFEVLEAEKGADLFGIFHCFTGTLEQAKQAISYNMKLGIGGVATFKKGKIDKFLNEIDIKDIVLETDSPYLAPTPYRGKRNESAYLTNVVDKLVDIYGLTFDEISAITTQNSKDIFSV